MKQPDRAADVCVDHMVDVIDRLIEKGMAEAMAGIGNEMLDRAHCPCPPHQLLNTIARCEIDLQRLDLASA
jgi:hypothetical protein